MLRSSLLTISVLLASCANPGADRNSGADNHVASPGRIGLTGSSPTYLMTSAQPEARGGFADQATPANDNDPRPPIDRTVPAQFQTATFALG